MKMTKTIRSEIRSAQMMWGKLAEPSLRYLAAILKAHRLSVAEGHVIMINGRWFISHAGLLRIAARRRCHGIRVQAISEFCDVSASRFAFWAVVYTTPNCKGFSGFGDADPSNVSPLVHGAEMRVAETRAVNRALRKAYGIGLCSVEEIGSFAEPQPPAETKKLAAQPADGNAYGGPKVRDRLCQIIRQHQLDPTLVKAYATDFCGTKSLREASREQVENFVAHLSDWAEKDRNALLCQLNSYGRSTEGVA